MLSTSEQEELSWGVSFRDRRLQSTQIREDKNPSVTSIDSQGSIHIEPREILVLGICRRFHYSMVLLCKI